MGEQAETPAQREQRLQRYRSIPEPGPLEILPNGLEIIRRTKHEPISLDRLSRERIAELTGKKYGSKFSADWTLLDYVDWVRNAIAALGWTPATGPAAHDFHQPQVVGICRGRRVRTIHIMSDGRNVHAYPVEDA